LVPVSAGVVFVPALTGLGAPDWDPDARGAVFGITRGTRRAHLIRATLEAIAFEVRDVFDVMVTGGWRERCVLRADGGAAANGLLLQPPAGPPPLPVGRPPGAGAAAPRAAVLARPATRGGGAPG